MRFFGIQRSAFRGSANGFCNVLLVSYLYFTQIAFHNLPSKVRQSQKLILSKPKLQHRVGEIKSIFASLNKVLFKQ